MHDRENGHYDRENGHQNCVCFLFGMPGKQWSPNFKNKWNKSMLGAPAPRICLSASATPYSR